MPEAIDVVLVSDVDEEPPLAAATPVIDYFSRPLSRLNLSFRDRPPHPQQLGVVALGTYLRRRGFSVRAFDNVFRIPRSREAFLDALDQGPKVVGLSTAFLLEAASVRRITAWVRERCPGALLVLGGASAERRAEIRELGDATVCGPGELSLERLLRVLEAGGPLETVPNLILPGPDGWRRTAREPGLSVSEIPPPDWDLLAFRPSLCYSIEASKGCRYNCAFCSYEDKGRQAMKPVSLVVDELRRVHARHGARLFRFVDANLTSWPEQTEALCRAIAGALPVEWGCYARADNFFRRPSLARRMKEAGCRWVFMGIESGSDRILGRMRKGCTAAMVEGGVARAKEAGLYVHGNFIVGFPGETRESVHETLELVAGLGLDTVSFFVLAIHDGSDAAIARAPEGYGLEGHWVDWRHPSMDSEEARELAGECLEAVTHGSAPAVVGNETLVTYYLMGSGLRAEEGMDYLRSFKDYYRAERGGDAPSTEAALRRIAAYRSRLHEHIAALAEEGSPAPPPERTSLSAAGRSGSALDPAPR